MSQQNGTSTSTKNAPADSVADAIDSALTAATAPEDNAPAADQAPVPTATAEQAKKTLARWGDLCARIADHNYDAGSLAYQFIDEYLGAAPGQATAKTARALLVEEWSKHDDAAFLMDPATAKRTLSKRLDVLLAVNAVATLIGDGKGVAKGNGTKSGRGAGKKDSRIAWTKLREFRPLVRRENNDHAERWTILPMVADESRQLLESVVHNGTAVADVVTEVAKLVVLNWERVLALPALTASDRLLAEVELSTWTKKIPAPPAPPAEGAPDFVGPLMPPSTPSTPPAAGSTPPSTPPAGDKGTGERKPADKPVTMPTTEQVATLAPKALAEQVASMLFNSADPSIALRHLLSLAENAPATVKFDDLTKRAVKAFMDAK
jgi:hypothetical protein